MIQDGQNHWQKALYKIWPGNAAQLSQKRNWRGLGRPRPIQNYFIIEDEDKFYANVQHWSLHIFGHFYSNYKNNIERAQTRFTPGRAVIFSLRENIIECQLYTMSKHPVSRNAPRLYYYMKITMQRMLIYMSIV